MLTSSNYWHKNSLTGTDKIEPKRRTTSMELTIDWRILVAYISGFLAVVASLAAFLGNTEKIKNWWIGHNERKHKRFAKTQAPYCQSICPAPTQLMLVNESLAKMNQKLDLNTRMTLSILSDRLQTKADFYLSQGWMPSDERADLLNQFLIYHRSGGNGVTRYKVDMCLKLPYEQGGQAVVHDLAHAIEEEEKP